MWCWSGRRALRTAALAAVAWVAVGGAPFDGEARAAALRVRAPDGCVEARDLDEQVSVLVGRTLASVPGVDFDVEIAPAPGRGWMMRLETVAATAPGAGGEPARHTRELAGATCAELSEAAAVAIAMSIRSLDGGSGHDDDGPAAGAPPERAPAPGPAPPTSPAPRPPAAEAAASAAPPAPARVRGALALAAVSDAGALPHPGLGVGLEASLRWSRVWVAIGGAAFATQEVHVSPTAGGSFQLALGAVLACVPYELARFTALGCGGFELGRMAGRGLGVGQPRLGQALWEAARAELGAAVPLGPRLALDVRAGVAVPLSTPPFVVDGTTQVHQASGLTGRASVGLEIVF
jgi:hypothetical protein